MVDHRIFYYASLPVSGGEAPTLSLERDQFRTQLCREFGAYPPPPHELPPLNHSGTASRWVLVYFGFRQIKP